MGEVTPELITALTKAITDAIKAATPTTATETANGQNGAARSTQLKPPPFTFREFREADGTTVEDYFKRFDWALELSKISEEQYANYARVHMGMELNNALKFLVAPETPESRTYEQIRTALTAHFDSTKNKYAESVKFRHITQQKGESIASFALRLRQGATHCDYKEHLDRMLIEQLLHGLSDSDTCDEIISKKPDTFKDAYEIAHALDSTRQIADEVKSAQLMPAEKTHLLMAAPTQYRRGKQSRDFSSRNTAYRRTQNQPSDDASPRDPSRRSDDSIDYRTQHVCNGCGATHKRIDCPYRESECHKCKKKGHIARVCRSNRTALTTDQVDSEEYPAQHIDTIRRLNKIEEMHTLKTYDKVMLRVQIDGHNLEMELDTGAPCGIISSVTLRKIKSDYRLHPTNRQFMSYTHHRLNCIGRISVSVTLGKTSRELDLYVIEGEYDSLFGREWLAQFKHELDWDSLFPSQVHAVSATSPHLTRQQQLQIDQLLVKHEEVFSNSAGKLIGPPVKMHLRPGATPVFARARDIPYALRDTYAKEIDAKLASAHYTKVDYSEWASTTHVVTKKNGKIRITGNYKPTLNPRIIIDEHPIPKAEQIFGEMEGATIFAHLDITDAYTHLPVDEEFSHALTLNTPTHGLIRPTRAVYGAANIPAIWQRRIEAVTHDIKKVRIFFDDLLVFASTFEELILTLDGLLTRLREHGLRLNRAKCIFAAHAVEMLGHKIDAQGIHKSDTHIAAIRDAPKPSTPDELELFIGKTTYYSAFIPDLATIARPLRDMLLVEPFQWTAIADKAHTELKSILISPQVLIPYDPSLPLLLASDASKTGLGVVLSHRLSNGLERPIAYASRTLTATEQRYPQIDKEALAIVYGVHKFFNYLYARRFTLITDHKPLTQILHPEKSLPVLCISRMANYADYLAHFTFDIQFKSTKANANADYCSRAPLPATSNCIHKIALQEGEEVTELN